MFKTSLLNDDQVRSLDGRGLVLSVGHSEV